MRAKGVRRQSCPSALNLIRRFDGPSARAANHYAQVCLLIRQLLSHSQRRLWIVIDSHILLRRKIHHVIAQLLNLNHKLVLKLKPRMVHADR
jgi:hypothetical protein